MLRISRWIVLVTIFLQQRYNLLPTVLEMAEQPRNFFLLAFIAALRISRRFRSRFQFNQFTDGDDNLLDELSHEDDPTTDDDGDNLICEMILNADNYQLCKAKTAYSAVLEKIITSLAEKTLTATEVPHLDTKASLTKLVNVAKTVGLDVSTILA